MKSILFTLLISPLFLFAQKTNTTSKKMKGEFYMVKELGASFQKFNGINSRIAGFPQYEQLEDHMYILGLGSMHVTNNFINMLTVTGGSSLSGDRDRRSTALRFLSGALDLGYDVVPSDKVMLYPLVGISIETYHALFYRDNSGVNFNDVLSSTIVQNSINSTKFVNNFFNYRAGIGFALKSPRHPGFIGLHLLYNGSFKNNKSWKSGEYQDLNGAPQDDLKRFQVSLIFGGASKMMR